MISVKVDKFLQLFWIHIRSFYHCCNNSERILLFFEIILKLIDQPSISEMGGAINRVCFYPREELMDKHKRQRMSAIIIAVLLVPVWGFSVKFRWQVRKGAKYKILSYVYEEAFRNSVLQHKVEIRHKAVLNTSEVKKNAGLYTGDFYYYQRKLGGYNLPFRLKKIYPTRFWRDTLGRYSMDKDVYMPVVRNVPVFPVSNIKPGTIWKRPGYEVHDLKQYGIKQAYRIPMNVRYIYVGDEVIKNRRYAKFSVTYLFSHLGSFDFQAKVKKAQQILQRIRRTNPRQYYYYRRILQQKLNVYGMAPKRITGSSIQLYYWDIEAGVPYKVDEDFHFIFHLFNGNVDEYKGHSVNRFYRVNPMPKKDAITLVKKIRNKNLKGVIVKRDKRGIVLRFADILFDYKKHSLKPEARRRLAKITGILQQYKKYDIRVEGHTDNIGNQQYNLRLSRNRASTVAKFLSKNMGIAGKRLSWIGYGKRRPIAPNTTEDGRRRNRRVEIIILTEE